MARTNPVGGFDAVVIGSGMGGLAAAAILASCEGKRVLVLERHFRAGGFTHTFSRPGGYHWDVGVHYVGAEVAGEGMGADAFRVATDGAVVWRRMEDPFERLVFPGFEFEIRSGAGRFEEDLVRAFPAEERGIRRFLRDVSRASSAIGIAATRGLAPRPVQAVLEAALRGRLRLAERTTAEVVASHLRDPRLRAVAAARWGDCGPPPSQSAFAAHATITRHFLDGGFYPEGSAATIAQGARRAIEAAGGAIRVRAEVERILVEGGRAAGVRLAGGEEIRAPVVVSDAGARNTFLRLVPEEVPLPFRSALRAAPRGLATVVLYLGLSRSPAALGVRGENFWLHDDLDHEAIWARRGRVLEGEVAHAYLSFPSLKDPLARAHTAEIVTVADAADFARWSGEPWRRRGGDYQALKERIADGMLRTVERRLPGFRDLVAFRELSTPLTTEHFTAHPGGEIYGIPFTPARLRMPFLRARTAIPGLFLAGADAAGPGIMGATMGGLLAAAAVAGPSIFRTVRARARALRARASRATPAATFASSA